MPPLPRKLYGRARSALVKERVKRGNASLADIIAIGQADAAIGEMRLLDLLASMPGMDKIQSKNVMEELGISDSCRLRRLDPTQRSALIRAFAERQLLETANQAGTPDTTERAATGTVDSANRSGDAAKPGQAPREPLFLQPTESSPGVTRGWPCEYYRPDSPNGAYCLRPPIGRTPIEMADAANKLSGDRLLVICQTSRIDNGPRAQLIHNDAGQRTRIWDMVAVSRQRIAYNSTVAHSLRPIPGMKGFYAAYTSDLWLGNTGWHDIPCR